MGVSESGKYGIAISMGKMMMITMFLMIHAWAQGFGLKWCPPLQVSAATGGISAALVSAFLRAATATCDLSGFATSISWTALAIACAWHPARTGAGPTTGIAADLSAVLGVDDQASYLGIPERFCRESASWMSEGNISALLAETQSLRQDLAALGARVLALETRGR